MPERKEKYQQFFIITGGPGAGKSTLVEALAAQGFAHMPEGGRAIIRDQLAMGGTALPWADRAAFAELMLRWDLRSYRKALHRRPPVIFDRAIPDVIAYRRLSGLPIPGPLARAAQTFRYHRRVFLAPPWLEIFHQDSERKQTFAEAEATYRALVDVYSELGYEGIALPCAPLSERVQFVQAIMSENRESSGSR